MKKIILAVFIFTMPFSCLAQTDGNTMLRACNAAVDLNDGVKQDATGSVEAVTCMSYVAGYLDALWVMRSIESKPGANSDEDCIVSRLKAGVPTIQVVRIFAKYLHSHPEHLDGHAAVLLVVALREAFPCSSKP